ncbi:hypothetical protein [Paraburkholderia pallida]|uniref:Transmembrane protein n=1 Tax=Paraburkholderia pallida TaxID=2547399 RepID=A0A4P7D1J8_9BURK|nr:hypothetical protein [Paraburkholderia pallida]QBR00525.1 hypothetical protein E1956_26185 [Paraburkholderia pallida]
MPHSNRYLRIVRASAWYDIVATSAFTTPWTLGAFLRVLNGMAVAMSTAPVPPFDPVHTLFANLLGSVVLVWAAVRLWRTVPAYGIFDGVARVLFALWEGVALYHGATPLIVPFLVVELAFGAAQLLPVVRDVIRRRERGRREECAYYHR